MLFFNCWQSPCDGQGLLKRSWWKIFEGAVLETFHVTVWFWAIFFLHDRFETPWFLILTWLAWRPLARLCIFGDNIAMRLGMAKLALLGFLGSQLMKELGVSRAYLLVFPASQLPACQQGAWKLQSLSCFPGFWHELVIWDMQSKALGPLKMQLPAQKHRNQLNWDLSCCKRPGCLKKSMPAYWVFSRFSAAVLESWGRFKLSLKARQLDFMLFSFKSCNRHT